MNNILKEEAIRHGDRLQIISVEHLEDLRRDIEEFAGTEQLNGFQKWIIKDMYRFEIPTTGFDVKSIIILAAHHPSYADIRFSHSGKEYETKCLVHSDFNGTKQYLTKALQQYGYHAYEADTPPLKRLAVQSGLAVYGRNNITYVEGLGSSFSYLAFFTDAPCEKDEWRKACHADFCDTCNACIRLCPTGAIRNDRFLIDNERCLSNLNESGGDFPDWLPKDIHHTLYDCLLCQVKCPLNKNVVHDTIGPFCFSEEETNMLLAGKGPEAFSEDFRIMADKIGLFDWPEGLPRNIRAVIDAAELKKHKSVPEI